MLKKFASFVFIGCFFLGPLQSFSQGVKFENATWSKVVNRAKGQHKMIFLQLQSEKCQECNVIADSAFNTKALGDFFNKRFVSVRLDGTLNEGAELAKKYHVTGFPVSLYIDENENLLNRYNGSTNNFNFYIGQANIAFSRKKEIPLETFENEYATGTRTPLFLESYIKKRNELKLPTASLLDEYVSVLPPDSLNSYRVISFIFNQAPELDSRAYLAMNRNPYTSKVYRNVGWGKAKEINNRIIVKTLHKAITQNDESLAMRVGVFAKNTWGKDTVNGQKGYDRQIMEYYQGTKQNDKYISSAINYYSRYYMSLDIDSIKIAEEASLQEKLNNSPVDTIISGGKMIIRKKIVTSSREFAYGNSLNTAAWNFYKLTDKRENLETAIHWIQRAIAYREDPAYIDTYAHLLYKLGRKNDAIAAQEKAVNIIAAERKGYRIEKYQDVLNKMKSNSLTTED